MSNAVIIVSQDSHRTDVKCPRCKRRIELNHESHVKGVNDEMVRVDLGQKSYTSVVCMNKGKDGRYYQVAAEFDVNSMRWHK